MDLYLYSDDINLLEYWKKSISYKTTCLYDIDEVNKIKDSFLVVNREAFSYSIKNLLISLKQNGNKILVMDRTPNIQTAKELLSIGVNGYGNVLMKAHFLSSAIDTIYDGLVWLHPALTSELIMQLPVTNKQESTIFSSLTSREKEVALLLKDGDTYKLIAEKLSITPRTVKAHASSVYKKLNVKDRLALAILLK